MKDQINTARLNALSDIESLDEPQQKAVRALRRKAHTEHVSPQTLGVLDTRDLTKLERLTDGKRLVKLSPATREILIAEVRECVYPYYPSVVALWSVWADRNGVDVSGVAPVEPPHVPEPEPDDETEKMPVVPPNVEEMVAQQTPPKPKVVRVEGASKIAENVLKRVLADGQEHNVRELRALAPLLSETSWNRAAERLNVNRRLDYSRGRGGVLSFWSMGKDATPATPDTPTAIHHGRDELRELLSGGELSLQQIIERFSHGRSILFEAAQSLHVVRRYESRGSGRIAFWRLPVFTHAPALDHPEKRQRAVYVPRSAQYDQEMAIEKICRNYNVAPSTLAHWAVMDTSSSGAVVGVSLLPDRESDEGVELADRVFRACAPQWPISVARRMGRRHAQVLAPS